MMRLENSFLIGYALVEGEFYDTIVFVPDKEEFLKEEVVSFRYYLN
jgi:hypothetical protein